MCYIIINKIMNMMLNLLWKSSSLHCNIAMVAPYYITEVLNALFRMLMCDATLI